MKIRTPILRPKGATGGLPASVFARRAHDRCQGLQSLVAIFQSTPARWADESCSCLDTGDKKRGPRPAVILQAHDLSGLWSSF